MNYNGNPDQDMRKIEEFFLNNARQVWMCEVLHGGWNGYHKEVYEALKEYEKRAELRKDFGVFFEQAKKLAPHNKDEA